MAADRNRQLTQETQEMCFCTKITGGGSVVGSESNDQMRPAAYVTNWGVKRCGKSVRHRKVPQENF